MESKVYRNLHNGKFSIVQNGVVVGHAAHVEMQNVLFKVSEAGRQRVIVEKRKNVHAFVTGEVTHVLDFTPFKGRAMQTVNKTRFEALTGLFTYNPYKGSTFVDKYTGEALMSCKRAIICTAANRYGN